MEIFVTDTHTRMALAVLRELGRAGFEVAAVTRASKPAFAQASRYVKKRIVLPDDNYADALLRLGSHNGVNMPVLLATGMHTLNTVAARRDVFNAAFHLLVPERDALNAAGDKTAVMQAARALGLNTPEEYSPEAPKFPCVIKYKNGEALQLPARERYAVVNEQAGYQQTLTTMRCKGEVFVSQYIPGGAYGVSAVLDNASRPLAVFCHERIREYPVSGGPACLARSLWHQPLVDAALALLEKMRLSGFAMVEFKGALDKPYVLEINPRIWGTYPLSALCGAGMAAAYVRGATGEHVVANPYKTGVRMQYLPNDVMHLLDCLRAGRGFKGAVIADFLSPRVRGGVFDFFDLPGTLAYAGALLKKSGVL